MADNVVANAGTGGATFATDDDGVAHHPYVKIEFGADNTQTKVSAANPLPVDASGVAIPATQSGTWTVQPGNTANTTAWKVDASSVAVPVTDNSGSLTVDNAGTFAVQATIAAGATSIAKAEDVASADADVGVPALAVRKATPANTSGTDGDYEFLQISAGRLWASATIDAALPAGTNGIGKLTANSGVTIGAVELAAAQTLATVTTVSTVTGGGVAHDGADSGNPIKVGAKAETSPKGITLVADGDRSDLYCDADGILMVKTGTAFGDLISERVSDTGGTSTAFSTFGAVASTRNFVTQITVHNAHATTNGYLDIRDGTAGAVLWTIPLPATGGATIHFNPPLRQPTANTALAYDVSAAITTIYISVNGFQSKA